MPYRQNLFGGTCLVPMVVHTNSAMMNENPKRPEENFRQFTDSFSDAVSQFGKKVGSFVDDFFKGEEGGELSVAIDAYFTKADFVIEVELPGVMKEDVSLQVLDQVLNLKGVKRMDEHAEQHQYLGRERRYGHFLRSLELPAGLDLEQIKAKYEYGVLRIRFARLKPEPTAPESGSEIDID